MKPSRFTVTVITPIFLTACMSGQKYQEVYVEECDHMYKQVIKEKINPDFRRCNSAECITSGAFIYSTIGALATLDENTQQQKYYQEFKEACAKKGIVITEKPTEKRIYLNKRVPTKKNINSDSELSDIER
jgi:hypothetical protein